jgi:hypothetical protein
METNVLAYVAELSRISGKALLIAPVVATTAELMGKRLHSILLRSHIGLRSTCHLWTESSGELWAPVGVRVHESRWVRALEAGICLVRWLYGRGVFGEQRIPFEIALRGFCNDQSVCAIHNFKVRKIHTLRIPTRPNITSGRIPRSIAGLRSSAQTCSSPSIGSCSVHSSIRLLGSGLASLGNARGNGTGNIRCHGESSGIDRCKPDPSLELFEEVLNEIVEVDVGLGVEIECELLVVPNLVSKVMEWRW